MSNYSRGAKKEYAIIKKAKAEGQHIIAVRSAGSHSPVDVWILDPIQRTIRVVQSKLNKYGLTKKEEAEFLGLSGTYKVQAIVVKRGSNAVDFEF